MAYTDERLKQVIRVFLRPKHQIRSDETDTLKNNYHKYTLRKRPVGIEDSGYSTWIDDDSDDTYDPRELRATSKKRARVDDSSGARASSKRKTSGSLIITMNVKSDAGKAYLSSLPIYQDDHEDQEDAPCQSADDLIQMTPESSKAQEDQSSSGLTQIEISQSSGTKTDQKKGCTTCWAFNLECLLAKDPFAYPCNFCRESGMDCELFDPPQWKRACEACRESKRKCSYEREDTDHHLACKECCKDGHSASCFAGPARCKPEASTPQATAQNPSSNGTRIIRTSLAHPVNFTYQPPADGTNPCHWCSNFAYGIVGLGRRTVEVIEFEDGRNIEIEGGHVACGHEPSRMCVTCALERIHIMRCRGHRLIPLKGYAPASFDFAAAYQSLTPTPGQTTPKKINPWCSLCPHPAFYGCSAIQTVNSFQEPVEPSSRGAIGCGLLLCERCELLMRAFAGDLGRVVTKNEVDDAEFGSRADAVYLLPGNDLYRCYIPS